MTVHLARICLCIFQHYKANNEISLDSCNSIESRPSSAEYTHESISGYLLIALSGKLLII